MHRTSPLWIEFPGDVEQFRDRRVRAELRMGRRWHFVSTGTIRVSGPDDQKRVAIDLVMAVPYPKPGHERTVIPLEQAEVALLVRVEERDCDFRYDGVVYLSDDEYEDAKVPGGRPKIVSPDDVG
jgi:hypothetical protein